MKKVYRYENNRVYWNRRWREAEPDKDQFERTDIYPIKYAKGTVTKGARILELGTGLGRIIKHFHNRGFDIYGLERSKVAIEKLKRSNSAHRVVRGDVVNLPVQEESFDIVLAFGVFHNLESRNDFEQALQETAQCLRKGGKFCISMRPNNIEMRLNEWYWLWRQRGQSDGDRAFHKRLVGQKEFRSILYEYDLITEQTHYARNVSILYRFPWLRAPAESEAERRSEGYRLNRLGQVLDSLLVTIFPSQFCNVLVFEGHKRK